MQALSYTHLLIFQIHAMMETPIQQIPGETVVIGMEKCPKLVENTMMMIFSHCQCAVYAKVRLDKDQFIENCPGRYLKVLYLIDGNRINTLFILAQGFQQIWGNWAAWSHCSATCGGGSQERSRTCVKTPVFADDCAGPKLESKTCGNMPCDISKYKHIMKCETQSLFYPMT